MSHDRTSTEPGDARLSALYRTHVDASELPSAGSDARILAMARDAALRPAVKPRPSGWRSWLGASWFGPGLAFATLASLSVAIVALLPKEDLSVERAMVAAPDSVRPEAGATAAPGAGASSSVAPASETQAKAKVAGANEAARQPPQRDAVNAAPAAREPPPITVAPEKSLRQRAESASVAEPRAAAPNPFPAIQPPAAARREVPAAPAATDAAPAQRLDKSSLLSEPIESRMSNAPVAEVHDSAPTYPNESRPSLPLPYTYTLPRAPARDAAPGAGAAAGSLGGRGAGPQQSSATRKEEALERRAPEKSASSMAAAPATMFAAAPPPREPVQWIKDIQKLWSEGKTEQVMKELVEFKKQYPQHPLPEELKNLK